MGDREQAVVNVLKTHPYIRAGYENSSLYILAHDIVQKLDALPHYTSEEALVREIWWGVQEIGDDDDASARTDCAVDELIHLVRAEFPNLVESQIVNDGFEGNSTQFSPRAICFGDFLYEPFFEHMERLEAIAVQRATEKYPPGVFSEDPECLCKTVQGQEYPDAAYWSYVDNSECPLHRDYDEAEESEKRYFNLADPAYQADLLGTYDEGIEYGNDE